VGLLLSAPWAEDIDRLQALALSSNGTAARRSAENAGSDMLPAEGEAEHRLVISFGF